MKDFCNYHPARLAAYDCPNCEIYLCRDCIVEKQSTQLGGTKNYILCPKCNGDAQWLGAGNLIEPFWNRFPSFFLYPFNLKPLLLNFILSIVILLFFSKPSLLSLIAGFIFWGFWLKYSFAALRNTAAGDLNPPGITRKVLSEDYQEVFKQLLIYFSLFWVFGFITATFGIYAGIVSGITLIIFLPSIIILLVTTQSFFQAINPVLFVQLAFRMGKAYFGMYFFLILFYLAPGAVMHYGFKFLPMALFPFFYFFFRNYYTLISYHFVGYVLLQYHEEIGYEIDYDDFMGSLNEKTAVSGTEQSPLLSQVDIHIKEGSYDLAINLLRREMTADNAKDIKLAERYYRLLKLKNMDEEMTRQAKKYLELLVERSEKSTACEVFIECLKVDNMFAPLPPVLLKIAAWLKSKGKNQAALRAYNNFTKTYSADPMVATAYFRAAEILNERLGQKKKAASILRAVLKKYPDHNIVPFAQKYLKRLAS